MSHPSSFQPMSKASGYRLRLAVAVIFMICLSGICRAQSGPAIDPPSYFAQCLLNSEDRTAFTKLETELRENPYVYIVRLDWSSKRVFLLTKAVDSFGDEQFISWLGDLAEQASCIQVGLHGVDPVNAYPFTNCQN